MKFDPEKHHRRSIRLKDYDYSQEGAYFITVCAHNREIIFEDERYRKIVEECWFDLPRHYPHVELDEFVVMPNHVHGIVILVGAGFKPALSHTTTVSRPRHIFDAGLPAGSGKPAPKMPQPRAGLKPAPTIPDVTGNDRRHALSEIVRAFKTFSTRKINALRRTPGEAVWQRNYWEHIIRSEEKMNKIREYILANPAQWEADPENPGTGVRSRKDEVLEGLA
jgi:REP element-mobilizing transposase RayT